MIKYNKLLYIVIALFLSQIEGENLLVPKRANAAIAHKLTLNDVVLEVPDSSLLLLDRLNLRKSTTISYLGRARPKQTQVTVALTTSATPVTNSSTSSSSSSDEESRPCTCSLGVCKCCTGPIMDLLKQKACMRVTYHPGDFAFDVAMSWNDRILYENSLTGKNPRPVCINPPRLNNLKVCAKFYNVFFPGRNFHFCLAMFGQWRKLELFNMAFDCLRMGADGLAMIRPEDNGGITIQNPHGGVDAVVDSGDDIEDYDENVVKSLLDLFDRR